MSEICKCTFRKTLLVVNSTLFIFKILYKLSNSTLYTALEYKIIKRTMLRYMCIAQIYDYGSQGRAGTPLTRTPKSHCKLANMGKLLSVSSFCLQVELVTSSEINMHETYKLGQLGVSVR